MYRCSVWPKPSLWWGAEGRWRGLAWKAGARSQCWRVKVSTQVLRVLCFWHTGVFRANTGVAWHLMPWCVCNISNFSCENMGLKHFRSCIYHADYCRKRNYQQIIIPVGTCAGWEGAKCRSLWWPPCSDGVLWCDGKGWVMVWYGMIDYGMVWYDMLRYVIVWSAVAQYGIDVRCDGLLLLWSMSDPSSFRWLYDGSVYSRLVCWYSSHRRMVLYGFVWWGVGKAWPLHLSSAK